MSNPNVMVMTNRYDMVYRYVRSAQWVEGHYLAVLACSHMVSATADQLSSLLPCPLCTAAIQALQEQQEEVQ